MCRVECYSIQSPVIISSVLLYAYIDAVLFLHLGLAWLALAYRDFAALKTSKEFSRWYMAVQVDWNLLHSCRWWFHFVTWLHEIIPIFSIFTGSDKITQSHSHIVRILFRESFTGKLDRHSHTHSFLKCDLNFNNRTKL